MKCPNCSEKLEAKQGKRKVCAQIGNPDIAIVEVENPDFCNNCHEFYMDKAQMISAIKQIKESSKAKKSIQLGVYSE
jgi:hypothetical protein